MMILSLLTQSVNKSRIVLKISLVIKHRLQELGLDQRDLAGAARVTDFYNPQLLIRKPALSKSSANVFSTINTVLRPRPGAGGRCQPKDARRVIGNFVEEDSQALIISPPSEVVSVAAAGMRSGKVRPPRVSFIDGQGTSLQGLPIQPGNCPLNVFSIAKLDKSETLGGSGYLVAHHNCGGHLETRVGHKIAKRGIGGAMR